MFKKSNFNKNPCASVPSKLMSYPAVVPSSTYPTAHTSVSLSIQITVDIQAAWTHLWFVASLKIIKTQGQDTKKSSLTTMYFHLLQVQKHTNLHTSAASW